MKNYKYIYGPVPSWRLGSSLGVDPLSQEPKICSFDCIYCQLGPTEILTAERKHYVETGEVVKEIRTLPDVKIDYITFSGRGEPTLAANLGDMIDEVRKIRSEKIAVITNSSLLGRDDVQRDVLKADCVIAKLDAASPEMFDSINRPVGAISFNEVVEGIRNFKKTFKGKLALQIMFVEENKNQAADIARLARDIGAEEVELNTPLRKSPVKPLSEAAMSQIKNEFRDLNTIMVYDVEKKNVILLSSHDTLKRRGKSSFPSER